MKKLVSSLLACTVAACSLFSCGSNSSSDDKNESTKKASKKDKSSAADVLLGKWQMDGIEASGVDGGGLIFAEGGKGGIYEDTSSMLHFIDEGLSVGGTTISTEFFKEDGDNLIIDVSGQEMLNMTKIEAKTGYDGKYSLNGGILYDSIVSGLQTRGLDEGKKLDININFDGTNSEVVFNDLFSYKVDGSKLTVSGFSGFLDSDKEEVSADFSVDNDKLTLKDNNKDTVLTRVK